MVVNMLSAKQGAHATFAVSYILETATVVADVLFALPHCAALSTRQARTAAKDTALLNPYHT